MELFVVNRHEGALVQPDVDEKANIDKLLKRIEKNKLKRLRQRQLKKEAGAVQAKIVQQTKEKRRKKREIQARSVHEDSNAVIEPENEVQQAPPKKKIKTKDVEGFTVLGVDKFDKRLKAKRVLPKWLTTPTIISTNLQDLDRKVSSMKELDKILRKQLIANGITYFFPVQATVIPWLIQSHKHSNFIFPRDICVSAPTGSGKTLAFTLPIIQALKSYHMKRIRALVILPTQDLALQVFHTFKKYTQDTHIDVCCVTGKSPFTIEQSQLVSENEAFGFLSKIDILVCTAGRLVEHLKETKGLNLRHLLYLVIDEADRVLDNVQNDWLYHLEKHMYQDDMEIHPSKILNLFTLRGRRPPQKLLFSATLSQDPEKLQKLSLFQPKLFTSVLETNGILARTDAFIGKYTTPKELTEKYIQCSLDLKPLVLYEFIKQNNLTRSLIFVHSVESAHRLAILLQALFKEQLKIEDAASQHETNARNDLIVSFCKGNIDILVCTDRLSRGMDLAGVQCVISYSPPKYLKTYIHRVGRTARAGELGLAVTLLHKTQFKKFVSLLQQGGKDSLEEIEISEDGLEQLGEEYQVALSELSAVITKEEAESLSKIKSVKRRSTKSANKKPKKKLNKVV